MGQYDDLIAESQQRVKEIMPWDLKRALDAGQNSILVDVREPSEFAMMHIPGSINVPRGVLEQSCEWDYDETEPELAARRDQEIVVICRSGKRSILAADILLRLGFIKVTSLQTGLRGWIDYDQSLVNGNGDELNSDACDVLLVSRIRPEQKNPKSRK